MLNSINIKTLKRKNNMSPITKKLQRDGATKFINPREPRSLTEPSTPHEMGRDVLPTQGGYNQWAPSIPSVPPGQTGYKVPVPPQFPQTGELPREWAPSRPSSPLEYRTLPDTGRQTGYMVPLPHELGHSAPSRVAPLDRNYLNPEPKKFYTGGVVDGDDEYVPFSRTYTAPGGTYNEWGANTNSDDQRYGGRYVGQPWVSEEVVTRGGNRVGRTIFSPGTAQADTVARVIRPSDPNNVNPNSYYETTAGADFKDINRYLDYNKANRK